MTSYKNVGRYLYTKNPTDVVALREYILFEDEKKQTRYALLKFVNNLDQPLYAVQFEVYQYDADEKLLGKSLIVYDKFTAAAQEEFVPKAKLPLDWKCKTISVKLISAYFDRIRWENGTFTDNKYSFDRYVGDVQAKPPQKVTQQTESSGQHYVWTNRQKPRAGFGIRDITHKNMAAFPTVFIVLTVILILAFVAGTAVYFRLTSKIMTVGDFRIDASSAETAVIVGYDGLDKNVTIPAKIGDRRVTRIETGAFRRSHVTDVTIEAENVTIAPRAFENCNSLKTLTSDSRRIVVSGHGFENCKNIRVIRMVGATVSANGFYGSTLVETCHIGSCTADTVVEMFGTDTMTNLQDLSIASGNVPMQVYKKRQSIY